MEIYHVLGLMSGTSLDGLDIALCTFQKDNSNWKYKLLHSETYLYSKEWKINLENAHLLSAQDFCYLDVEYGKLLGEKVNDFIKNNKIKNLDFISSHGHTIFHQPDKGISIQIGSGEMMAAITGFPVINNFRSMDVALGGQGAPLVPIGDKLLFSDYDFCLNLGGFANISMDNNGKRIAFDICPVNIILNKLSLDFGKNFDESGQISSSGKINQELLRELNNLTFYKNQYPKSLSREWLEKEFLPAVNTANISSRDKLRTIVEHIALQIYYVVNLYKHDKKILVTGGGAFNTFLINEIRKKTKHQVIVPDALLVNYKEALVFAFLGVLRMRNEVNCLSSVTGAKRNNIGGILHILSN